MEFVIDINVEVSYGVRELVFIVPANSTAQCVCVTDGADQGHSV